MLCHLPLSSLSCLLQEEICCRCVHQEIHRSLTRPRPRAGRIWKRSNHGAILIRVWGKLGQGNHVIIETSWFSKSLVFKMFSVHTTENANPKFSKSSSLKSVFEKPCSRDGFVWTVSLTVEIKLRFQIPLARCRCCAWEKRRRLFCCPLTNGCRFARLTCCTNTAVTSQPD